MLLLLLLPGVPHKPLTTRWTRSSVATAVEDDADAAAIRETLAAYRFAGKSVLVLLVCLAKADELACSLCGRNISAELEWFGVCQRGHRCGG
jgi:hypothetical protein